MMMLKMCLRKYAKLGMMLLFVALTGCLIQSASRAAQQVKTGILVVAPDRGFLGNQEIGDGFDQFAAGRNAAILYVADARSKNVLAQRVEKLTENGAEQIVALPLFISAADARWQLAKSWLAEYQQTDGNLLIAEPYGSSYLAVEDLSARLRQSPTDKKKLLLVGYGAATAEAAEQMKAELKAMGEFASTLSGDDIQVAISPTRGAADSKKLQEQFDATVKSAKDTLVVPVLLAFRADEMMSFLSWFSRSVPKDAQLVASQFSTPDQLQQWLTYATNKVLLETSSVDAANVGVISLAHGADWFWNQAMRDSLAPVAKDHKLAFAFSMGEQPIVARAVHELEKQSVRGIVLVRIFSQTSSFLPGILRMIGADVSNGKSGHSGGHGGHGGMMMMHGMMGMSHGSHGAMSTLGAPPRIRSSVPVVTVGGVEDSKYFAKALLANARSISTDPSRETIILTGHGAGRDEDNERWLKRLSSLAEQMKNEDGYNFKEIRSVTWREDWPDKKDEGVGKAQEWVAEINAAGGRVLIVPARTNGRGAADRYLKGLNFGWSEGFAQTPYLSQWFEEQIKLGTNQLVGEKKAHSNAHH